MPGTKPPLLRQVRSSGCLTLLVAFHRILCEVNRHPFLKFHT